MPNNKLSPGNPHRNMAAGHAPASAQALAWEREQTAPPTYESNDFSEEAVQSRAEQAAADPESFYADLIRDQFADWMNRFFPVQQEAVDIAMGNDRERRAMDLGQQALGNIPIPIPFRDPVYVNALDGADMNDPEVRGRVLDTGYRALAGQERMEVGDTTRKAFDIGADVGNRTRQRYGLNIGQSATQERGRDVNQALATVGGVNSMRDGLRDRQDYLMTGSSSAMSGIFNQMAG